MLVEKALCCIKHFFHIFYSVIIYPNGLLLSKMYMF